MMLNVEALSHIYVLSLVASASVTEAVVFVDVLAVNAVK